MSTYSTRQVCAELGLTEPRLRALLRKPDAPRPSFHPSARIFLWTRQDVHRWRRYLARAVGDPAPTPDRAPAQEAPDASR